MFLAHLYLYSLDNPIEYLEELVKANIIDGVETYYPRFTKEQVKTLEDFCEKHKVFMSGGSDCHGTKNPMKVGTGLNNNLNISEKVVKPWINSK